MSFALLTAMETATIESPKIPKLTPAMMRYFWPYVRPDAGKLVISFVGLGIQAAFSVVVTMVPAILERHWTISSRNYLFMAIGGILAVNMLVLVVQSAVSWTMTNVTENVVRRVKLAIFKKVGSLPSEEMNFQVVGKFAQRTTGDVMRLGGLVSPGITQAAFSLLQLVFMLIALFWLDWRFALILPLVVALIWVIVRKINEKVNFWARKDQLEQERVLTHFIESIGGVRDLVACGRFDNAAKQYDEELVKKQRYLVLSAWWNNLAGMVPTAMFSFMIFGYYLWRIGRTDFGSGQAEVGTMLTYAGNLLMAQGLVLTLFKLLTETEMSAPSLYELKRLLEADEVPDAAAEVAIGSGEVVFDNVTFTYGMTSGISGSRRMRASSARTGAASTREKPSESAVAASTNGAKPSTNGTKIAKPPAKDLGLTNTILNEVTFKIEPGTFAAIVGQSGSGKSTLFYILLRLLEPLKGDVTVGGLSLGDIPLRVLRNYIGFIPQAPFIFSGTIRQNLLMGADESEVSKEQMDHVIDAAKLGDLIAKRSKAGGLDASVGSGGASLSAGERQRIALARVFLRNPGIVVCDEYTANIDNATAKLIHNALKNEFAGKTRIVITHQLYTVRGADCIFVLDEGRIVEQGTHDKLISNDGLYKDMWEVQRLG